jgi:DNA-binding transcriptional regulator LsrR (DeoR family)
MEQKYETQLLVKVAQMYYVYGNKQSEIAEELKISRSSVSLILTEAKERGIVEVKYIIKNPLLNNDRLSREIENLFDIKRCIVIPIIFSLYLSSINSPCILICLAQISPTGFVLSLHDARQ